MVCVYSQRTRRLYRLPEYQENQKKLRRTQPSIGAREKGLPPREGPALPQGLAICGKCGEARLAALKKGIGDLSKNIQLKLLIGSIPCSHRY